MSDPTPDSGNTTSITDKATDLPLVDAPPVVTPPPAIAAPPLASKPAAPPPKIKTGRGIAWLALLVALGAGGGGAYLWYLWQLQQAAATNQINQAIKRVVDQQVPEIQALKTQLAELGALKDSLVNLRSEDQNLKEQLLGLAGDVQPLKNAMELQKGETEVAKSETRLLRESHETHKASTEQQKNDLAQQLAKQQTQIAAIDKKIKDLQLAIAGLNAELETVKTIAAKGGDAHAFQLAEVEYLLRLAESKLKMEGNLPTARAALDAAQQRLKGIPEAGLASLQTMLGEAIASLRGVQLPDISALSHKLLALEKQIDQLPLQLNSGIPDIRERVKPASAVNVSEDETRPWWERGGEAVWNQFKEIVVVRRQRIEAPPLIARENEFFLRENLRLELEGMRLALLRGDAETYQEMYQRVTDWITQYFDTNSAKVKHFLAELKALQTVQFSPYVPDLAGLRQAFQDFIGQRQPVRALRPAAPAPAAPAPAAPAPAAPAPAAPAPAAPAPAAPAPAAPAPAAPAPAAPAPAAPAPAAPAPAAPAPAKPAAAEAKP